MTDKPSVSWAELKRIRADANVQLAELRARERANLAEGHRALVAYRDARLRARANREAAILAPLRAGKIVREICRELAGSPNRVCGLRALLKGQPSSDATVTVIAAWHRSHGLSRADYGLAIEPRQHHR